jgi:hypothetical protein
MWGPFKTSKLRVSIVDAHESPEFSVCVCVRPSPVMCVQNIQLAEWWGKIRVLVSSTTSNSIAEVNASSAIFCMCVCARVPHLPWFFPLVCVQNIELAE